MCATGTHRYLLVLGEQYLQRLAVLRQQLPCVCLHHGGHGRFQVGVHALQLVAQRANDVVSSAQVGLQELHLAHQGLLPHSRLARV